MSSISIVKVKTLQGMAKVMAEKQGWKPDDLVLFRVSMEKVDDDPVSFLLSKIQISEQKEAKGG